MYLLGMLFSMFFPLSLLPILPLPFSPPSISFLMPLYQFLPVISYHEFSSVRIGEYVYVFYFEFICACFFYCICLYFYFLCHSGPTFLLFYPYFQPSFPLLTFLSVSLYAQLSSSPSPLFEYSPFMYVQCTFKQGYVYFIVPK